MKQNNLPMPNKSRRKGKSNTVRDVVPRTPRLKDGMPPRLFIPMRYVSNKYFVTPTSGLAIFMWISSAFDPDFTGVGHQPMYYDQMTPIYRYNRVHSVKYAMTVVNSGAVPAQVFLSEDCNPTSPTASIETEMERPQCKHRGTLSSGYGVNKLVFRGKMDVAKTFGLTKAEFAGNDQFIASFGNNSPTYGVLSFGYTSDATAVTLSVLMELVLEVECWQRNDIASS